MQCDVLSRRIRECRLPPCVYIIKLCVSSRVWASIHLLSVGIFWAEGAFEVQVFPLLHRITNNSQLNPLTTNIKPTGWKNCQRTTLIFPVTEFYNVYKEVDSLDSATVDRQHSSHSGAAAGIESSRSVRNSVSHLRDILLCI